MLYEYESKNTDTPSASVVPRAVIFSGKAAPGYLMAKVLTCFTGTKVLVLLALLVLKYVHVAGGDKAHS